MTRRLPLTVIGGFLGAGKTTLLNHWLKDAAGRRIAVLVNDFGAIDVDAALIRSAGTEAIALSNGCVCCSIGDDLTEALVRVLEAGSDFDAVVIEASGVSDPWRIAQVGLADPGLGLDAVLVLVDAAAVRGQFADPLLADTLARQLDAADLIVLNKADLVSTEELAAVRAWLDEGWPRTPRHETVDARLPAELRDGPRVAHDDRAGHGPAAHAHDPQFAQWSMRPRGPLVEADLRGMLKAMPQGVLRLKGFVQTGASDWFELQFAGRRGSLRRMAQPPVGGAAVVAIGLPGRMPVAALQALFGPVA